MYVQETGADLVLVIGPFIRGSQIGKIVQHEVAYAVSGLVSARQQGEGMTGGEASWQPPIYP